jgi:hypothetical protein
MQLSGSHHDGGANTCSHFCLLIFPLEYFQKNRKPDRFAILFTFNRTQWRRQRHALFRKVWHDEPSMVASGSDSNEPGGRRSSGQKRVGEVF